MDQTGLPQLCRNMYKRIWDNVTILLFHSCLALNHSVLVTCCFLHFSYSFRASLRFLQTPVSTHNPVVKAASLLPWATFLRIIRDPHHFIVNRAWTPEKPFGMNLCWASAISWAATAWHNVLPYTAASQPSFGQGKKKKKGWKIFSIL